jgi:hypothetical protein
VLAVSITQEQLAKAEAAIKVVNDEYEATILEYVKASPLPHGLSDEEFTKRMNQQLDELEPIQQARIEKLKEITKELLQDAVILGKVRELVKAPPTGRMLF